MNPTCAYPSCPSGLNERLLDERHEEIKGHLETIEESQKSMIVIMKEVATLTADNINTKLEIKENKKQHDEMFSRLRKVELKVVRIVGVCAGIVAVLEVLRAIGIIK